MEAALISVNLYQSTRRHITSSSWICPSVRNGIVRIYVSWNSWINTDKQIKLLWHSHIIGSLTFRDRILFFLEFSWKDIFHQLSENWCREQRDADRGMSGSSTSDKWRRSKTVVIVRISDVVQSLEGWQRFGWRAVELQFHGNPYSGNWNTVLSDNLIRIIRLRLPKCEAVSVYPSTGLKGATFSIFTLEVHSPILKIEVVPSSETSITIQQTSRHYIPKDNLVNW
jgi:hypothetical protein